MAIHHLSRGAIRRPSARVAQSQVVPAPVKGIDATTILSAGDPFYCIYSFNLLPSEYGMRVRKGYREWQIELDNGSGISVNTIIPFGGRDSDFTDDKLFAVTNEGIWDVTADQGTPTLVIDFLVDGNSDITAEAGYGVYTNYVSDSGSEILFYADSKNGLYRYDKDTNSWAPETGMTGVDPTAVNFVMAHKEQLWMIERDSDSAWYLPAGAITGVADEFGFGTKFKHGGNLAGVFQWTIDGGEGVDDYFVAVSRAGDVLPYKGTDPGSDFALQGQWFIGEVPKGGKFATQDGGELYLLSVYGLTSMNEIIVGVDGKNINAETETKKISILVRNAMELSRQRDGWDVKLIPSQGILLITEPQRINGSYIQYARNVITNGWGLWRKVPVNCFDEWRGVAYVGTKDLRVVSMNADVDNLLITAPGPINGEDIESSILTTFQSYQSPSQFKRGKYIRPQFVADAQPQFDAQFRYDYSLTEVTSALPAANQALSVWDVSDWDSGFWDSGEIRGFSKVQGGWGMGRTVAVAMKMRTPVTTSLVSWDIMWDAGAPL